MEASCCHITNDTTNPTQSQELEFWKQDRHNCPNKPYYLVTLIVITRILNTKVLLVVSQRHMSSKLTRPCLGLSGRMKLMRLRNSPKNPYNRVVGH